MKLLEGKESFASSLRQQSISGWSFGQAKNIL